MSSSATAMQPAEGIAPGVHSLGAGAGRRTLLCLLLALLTLALYNPVVHNGFTNLDDDVYILDNAHVRAGLTWGTVKWAFTSRDASNWHPLTWLSHALDCQLFKLNPAGHHYVNVLLHAANVLLLFLLLRNATGFTWRSFMVAALFALHPVNVESVAWAAERKNVLSMTFFLLAMHAYGWYARRVSVKRYAAVAALFALGLMAKPEIITLPFVLLLWDYWPLERVGGNSILSSQFTVFRERPEELARATALVPRSFSFLFLEKVPLLLLSAASGVITVLAQSESHAMRIVSARVRYGNAVVACMRYLGKAFWPVNLAVLYPHPGNLLPIWEILASAAALILITALVLHWRSHRYLAVGWLWMLGTLVPVSGIVQVGLQAMADRYAYIPYIGLFICVVWGLAEVARERKIPAVWLGAPALLVLVTLGVLTHRQIGYWHDSETLWRHTLSITERNFMAHDALARALAKQGRIEEAMAEHVAVENLHAYPAPVIIDIGVFAQTHGHPQEAIGQYERALDASTDAKGRAVALSSLGSAFLQMGDMRRAKTSYAYALRENPDNGAALIGSGLLAGRDGDFATAAERIFHAMKVGPTDVGYLLLGQILRRAGREAEADEASAHAQRISPDLTQAQQSAAQAMASVGIKPD